MSDITKFKIKTSCILLATAVALAFILSGCSSIKELPELPDKALCCTPDAEYPHSCDGVLLCDGQKSIEATYKDGKLDGTVTMWYANGQKRSEINYKDDKLEGKSTSWHENGEIEAEATFKDGKCISGDCDF